MTTTQITEVRFRSTTKGRRAFRWCNYAGRWFPIAVTEAEMKVATGQATDVTNTNWL